ncbi:MAG: response regulator transcription factor [Desulfococcaceae bacterium]
MIADDHDMVRTGVRRVLEAEPGLEVVAEAADGATAARLIRRLRPDVAVLDIAMPGGSGLEVIRWVAEAGFDTRTVALSIYKNDAYLYQAFTAGARAYVLKPTLTPNLLDAIRAVCRDEYYLSPKIESPFIRSLVQEMRTAGAPSPGTEKRPGAGFPRPCVRAPKTRTPKTHTPKTRGNA